jgi:hypothetical protein
MRPLPHHLWRQCNSLSLTQEFYSYEWNILEPGVHSLIADDLTTGKSAGEFPLLYYVVAMIWKVVGKSEFIYRVLMLMLHAWGTWALFRSIQEILRDGAWAVMVSLFFFTVPAVVYFAISFITDVPALDLVLIGVLPMILYMKDGRRGHLIGTMLAFTCAILIKVTAAILPVALFLMILAGMVLPRPFAWPGLDGTRAR